MKLFRSIFNVKMSYAVIVLSLVGWALFGYFTMEQLINSQEGYSKIINVSGKQRMLSQKTTLMVNRVMKTADEELFEHLKELTTMMHTDHLFIINNLTSKEMIKIYFHKPYNIDQEIQSYLNLLDRFILEYQINPRQEKLVEQIEEFSFELLVKLDYAVNQFEKESDMITSQLHTRETYILLGTLLTLFIEMLIVIIPTLRIIQHSQFKLLSFNKILKETIKRKTKKLRKEYELKNFYLNNINATIIALDTKGDITLINKTGCEILGFDKDEVIGKNWFELKVIPSNELSIVQKYFTRAIKQDIDVSKEFFESALIDKDAEAKIFAWSNTIIKEEGKVVGILSAGIDITNERKQENIIKEQTKLASMGEMIANIAHQWRQPLSIISTAATGMQMQSEFNVLNKNTIEEMTSKINDNAQYLSQTIDDFRNFIRGDSQSIKMNLKHTIDRFIKLIDSVMNENKIEVIRDIDENIEFEGYPNELIQCFINFFNNAKDAMVENDIKKDERYIFISQYIAKKNIVIEFKDSAGGIPKKIITRVFEPYFTTKHQRHGTGLGLHLSRKLIVEGMKGKIDVENEKYKFEGKKLTGAKFTLKLPLH